MRYWRFVCHTDSLVLLCEIVIQSLETLRFENHYSLTYFIISVEFLISYSLATREFTHS